VRKRMCEKRSFRNEELLETLAHTLTFYTLKNCPASSVKPAKLLFVVPVWKLFRESHLSTHERVM
jgi:hypothetical protein